MRAARSPSFRKSLVLYRSVNIKSKKIDSPAAHPASKPSIPSMKLCAFVKSTIQNTANAIFP